MRSKLFFLFLIFITSINAQTIYVNQNATGANNGSSWADAYTNLEAALSQASATKPIWVAAGTYIPSTTNANPRKATFSVINNTKLYGGFNGTETQLEDRNPKINITILSGDLNGDDNGNIVDTEATRQDNSYHVISIRGNSRNIVIDGFTISGGNANGTTNNSCSTAAASQFFDTRGGAIYANPYASGHQATGTFYNCIIEHNTGTSVGVYSAFTPCGITSLSVDFNFNTCIIRDNYSRDLPNMLFTGSSGYGIYGRGSILNSALYNNSSNVNAACLYLASSTSNGGNASGLDFDLVNTTIANNTGNNGNVINMIRAGGARIRNTIIYDNGSLTPFVNSGSVAVMNNTIAEGGQHGNLDANPLFTDGLNNDFTLQPLSPAINYGDNAYLSSSITEDLNGDVRIYDTTIDAGAYEASTVCTTPLNLQSPVVSIYAADLTWDITNGATDYDIAYVLSGQPIGSATIVNNIAANTYTITGLLPSTSYDAYVRTNCSGIGTTPWSTPVTFTTDDGPLYVNHAATVANNGASWADAFTNLQDALALASATKPVWVAQGTYTPHSSDRNASFNLSTNTKLYGGFNGTETSISQRDPKTNITILSGDLNGNDNNVLLDTEPTRQDNSYHVIKMRDGNRNNIVVDGFTISGGNANGGNVTSGTLSGQYRDDMGGAIYVAFVNSNRTISADFSNCILEKNTGTVSGVYTNFYPVDNSSVVYNNTSYTINFESCIIRDNYSGSNVAMYFFVPGIYGRNGSGKMTNCLFYNNVSANYASCLRVGSTRTNGSGFSYQYNNNTFANNTGLNGNVINMYYGQGASFRNNIIYHNGSATPAAAAGGASTFPNTIMEGGQYGSINVDPLFNNYSSNDFTLSNDSPAIDAGNNSYIPSGITLDLAGNNRIEYGTVDMGVYEASDVCRTPSNLSVTNVGLDGADISWNVPHPTSSTYSIAYVETGQPIANGTTISGISGTSYTITGLVINTTYDVYVRSECNGALTSSWSLPESFTTLGPLFVDHTATGANDGSSWANAFTTLEAALPLATTDKAIWVAQGTYIPTTTNADPRKATYLIPANAKVYGGFNGTETDFSQRDPKNNITVLSGDLNGDDNGVVIPTETTRQDNAYHVISIFGGIQNIVIDGFTISGGNANGSFSTSGGAGAQYFDNRAAAIYSKNTGTGQILRATVRNCIIENNAATSIGVYWHFFPSGVTNLQGYVDFKSCIVRDNYSGDLSCFYYGGNKFYQLHARGTITNSLFYNNTSVNDAACIRSSSSTYDPQNNIWTPGSSSVTLINNTFTNNSGLNNKVLKITNGDNLNSFLRNSIVYGNGSTNPYDFNGVYGGITIQNTITTDPSFVSPTDFRLQSGSSAIDAGNNSYATAITTDLDGNARIYNGTIDLGCYEYDPSAPAQITVSPKILLGGPLDTTTGLMNDGLRANTHIPTTSPYIDALSCSATVFNVTGNDAIVDWVWVELRDENDQTNIVASTSALIQRDGDVVAIDGVSPLAFNLSSGNYFIHVNHRNHLGVMMQTTTTLSATNTVVDFSNGSAVTYGTHAQRIVNGYYMLWPGDSNGDDSVKFSGSSNDSNNLRDEVVNASGNIFGSISYSYSGYHDADVTMNGEAKFSGTGNDSNIIRDMVVNHPGNIFGSISYTIQEQLP